MCLHSPMFQLSLARAFISATHVRMSWPIDPDRQDVEGLLKIIMVGRQCSSAKPIGLLAHMPKCSA